MARAWRLRPVALVAYFECALIIFPLILLFASSFTTTKYLVFPPQGFTLQWYWAALSDLRFVRGMVITMEVAVLSSVVAVVLGVIAALALNRADTPFKRTLDALFLSPLTIPVIVFSIALLFFLQSIGLMGSITGLVIGHAVHSFPYAVRMVRAANNRSLSELEQAAAVLGAKPSQVFWRVTFPALRTGISAAFIFAALVSINNVTIALFVAGSRTKTLPLVMFNRTEDAITPDLAAMSSILTVITVGILIFLEKTVGVYGVLEQRR